MRVMVLGLDGVEATLINPDTYPNLCQAEYGTVSLEGFDLIQTPQIWVSFITGVLPEVHGVKGFNRRGLLSWMEEKLGNQVKAFIDKCFGLEGIQFFTKLKNRAYSSPYQSYKRDDIRVPTLFDEIPNAYAISLPVWNEPEEYTEIRANVVDAVNDARLSHKIMARMYALHHMELKELYGLMGMEWNLILFHMFLPDVYAHLYGEEELMRDMYKDLDLMVKELKTRIGRDTLFLIVSDHGSKRGLHTPYGFWSCNIPLSLSQPRITDFHDKILEATKWG